MKEQATKLEKILAFHCTSEEVLNNLKEKLDCRKQMN